ncbi:hypothetical protein [Undibacterium terreum]|uniref:hypothetical protein n=1 Tax=Undibacterium terreum TaxID=1224302 RepID=UPI00166B92DA|nr:hypothetical protein [Undibacterium terreum]
MLFILQYPSIGYYYFHDFQAAILTGWFAATLCLCDQFFFRRNDPKLTAISDSINASINSESAHENLSLLVIVDCKTDKPDRVSKKVHDAGDLTKYHFSDFVFMDKIG